MNARASCLAGVALAALLLAAPAALANGRFPAAGQVAVDPSDPSHLVVRATYGILSTHDKGAHWSWICENAVGYGGFEDPMMAITQDGSLLAGTYEGLSTSRDSGCQWDFAKGALDMRFVIDLATETKSPANVVLAISNSVGGGAFLTQVWQSSDNGQSFTQAGVDLPNDFLAVTLDAAPSDPQRLYVSGRYGAPEYSGVVQRSKDRGKTWEKLPIPGSNDQNMPYIGGVHPTDPQRVYVRLDGDPNDHLAYSGDGGDTWKDALAFTGNMLGFALSPDGATVAVGGDTGGIWTAPTDTLAFTKVSTVGAKCLTWTSKGLYACGNEFTDGFTLGLSTDAGKSFTPLMHLQKLCGPLECGAETSAGKTCPTLWGATQLSLGGASCGPDGGAGGGDTGSSSSGDTSGGSSSGSEGCSCDVAGGAASGLLPGLALAAAAALRASRRRRR
jgi:MYXO-CTERM domain-containing protein